MEAPERAASPMSRGRRILFALISAALAGALALVACEAVLRLTGSHSPASFMLETPGASLRDVETDWDLTYTLNSRGLRDEEIDPHPASGARRLVLIGDSFTFGQGCDRGEIFADRLEAGWRALGQPVDVVNISDMGLGAEGYSVLLSDVGLPLHPDVVIVNVFGNDAAELNRPGPVNLVVRALSHHSHLFTMLRDFRRRRVVAGIGDYWTHIRAIARTDELKQRVDDFRRENGSAQNNLLAGCLRDPDEVARWNEPSESSWGYHELSEALASMKRRCDRQRCRMVIAVVPDGAQVDPAQVAIRRSFGVSISDDVLHGSGKLQALMKRQGQKLGVRVFDPLEAFRRVQSGLFYPHDLHFTAEGHRLYAEGLMAFLTQDGFPTAGSPPVSGDGAR